MDCKAWRADRMHKEVKGLKNEGPEGIGPVEIFTVEGRESM